MQGTTNHDGDAARFQWVQEAFSRLVQVAEVTPRPYEAVVAAAWPPGSHLRELAVCIAHCMYVYRIQALPVAV